MRFRLAIPSTFGALAPLSKNASEQNSSHPEKSQQKDKKMDTTTWNDLKRKNLYY